MLTQAELKNFLHYNPDAGIFTWIKRPANIIKVGDIAGCKDGYGYMVI